jgi:hypothetical protein
VRVRIEQAQFMDRFDHDCFDTQISFPGLGLFEHGDDREVLQIPPAQGDRFALSRVWRRELNGFKGALHQGHVRWLERHLLQALSRQERLPSTVKQGLVCKINECPGHSG